MKTKINKNNFKINLLMGSILSISALFIQNNAFAQNMGHSTNIETIGSEPGNLEPLKGFARDLPLITVLKQITPNGWVVKKEDKDNDINVENLVSWKGGSNWVEVLDEVSQTSNFKAKIDWNKKSVTLFPRTSEPIQAKTLVQNKQGNSKHDMFVAPSLRKLEYEIPQNAKIISQEEIVFNQSGSLPAKKTEKASSPKTNQSSSAVFELESNSVQVQEKTVVKVFESDSDTPSPVVVGAEVQTVAKIAPLPKNYGGTAWVMDTSKSLKENVEAWGEKAGYRVVWNGEDYSVDDTRTLYGEFDSSEGPIKQLALDYGPDSRVQSPLAFQFYQNNTLVIEDFRYEQKDYAQAMH